MLKKIYKEFKLQVEKKKIILSEYTAINPHLLLNNKVYKLEPVSFSYQPFKQRNYIGISITTTTPFKLQYAYSQEPFAIFLHEKPKHIIYSHFPIFFFNKALSESFKLKFEEKKRPIKEDIWETTLGYGPGFFNIVIDISKNHNIQILSKLLEKLFYVNMPRGIRLRFLFIRREDLSFINEILKLYPRALFNFLITKPIGDNPSVVLKLNGKFSMREKVLDTVSSIYLPKKNIVPVSYTHLTLPTKA